MIIFFLFNEMVFINLFQLIALTFRNILDLFLINKITSLSIQTRYIESIVFPSV